MSNASEVRHVLVIEDQKSRRIVSLSDNTYNIGRDPTNAIVLYDRQVSRHHATLLRVNDYQNHHFSYRLIDGNLQGKRSTNGIMVNGQYCLSHELKHGDLIRFASKSKASYHVISVSTESDLDFLRLGDGANLSPGDAVFSPSPENLVAIADLVESFDSEESAGEDSAFNTAIIHPTMNKKLEEMSVNETVQLNRSTSLSEYSPQAIIEVSFAGQVLYLNAAATIKFPDLHREQINHPILAGLLSLIPHQDSTSFVRELEVGKNCYEQHIHFQPEQQLICCYVVDITKQRLLERDYKLLHQRYQLYRQLTTEGIIIVDADSKDILEANPTYCQMLGYGETEITGLSLYQVVAAAREIIDTQLQAAQQQEPFFLEETFHRAANGNLIGVSTNVYSTILRGRTVYCLSVRDRRSHQQIEEKLRYEQFHDPLTNLPNRQFLYQQLELSLNHARHHEHLLAILFLHLDSLATINQSLGHRIGDQSLQSFAAKVQSCLRSGDVVCYWGGATLCVLLPLIKNSEDTIKLAERIFTALEEPVTIENQTLVLTGNVGIVVYPQDGDDSDALLKNADLALARIPKSGGGHYQFFNPQLSEEARLQFRIERLLQQAIARKQLMLVYQPQVNLQHGTITGVEALLRWEHPEVSYLSPAKFIPLAAKTNLIFEMGQWVIKTACQQNLRWQKEGLPPFPIAVNLTSQEFYQNAFATMVAKILEEVGLDPHWLEFDITEETLRLNPTEAKKTLKDLTELGVRIALDDFGRGYASLGLLNHFPLRTIKLDQRFIRDLRGNAQENSLITAIAALGKGFNLRIIAEGVETEQQLNILRHLQCEEAQGYWFSRPLKVKEATQFLRQQFSE